jgi:hypothetical protein
MKALNQKRFNSFKLGRIDARREVSKQQRIRNNLERAVFPKINTAFRQFVNAASNEYSILEEINTAQLEKDLNSKLEVIMQIQYEKIFRTIFSNNEELYYLNAKADDVFVFGRSVDFERLVQEYTRSRVPYFTGMTSQLARELETVIFNGRADGLNLDQISRSITKKGFPISRRRANLIARTETHNAASFANHDYHKKVQQDLGTDMKKQWVSTSDIRTRSAHSSANGQSVSMDEDFIVGGARMSYAGDPKGGARNVINCRCIIIYAEQEAVIVDSQIEKDDYGNVLPEELEFHKQTDWNRGQANIKQAVQNTDSLWAVNMQKKGGAFYMPSDHAITMSSKYGKEKSSVIWRHEYGHAIDGAENNMKKILASNLMDDVPDVIGRGLVRASQHISTVASRQILSDRKKLLSINNKNKKLFEKNFIGNNIYNRSFVQKFGMDYKDGRYSVTKSLDDVVEKIRLNFKDTNGVFNTELLDKLLGKSWADDLLKRYIPTGASGQASFSANKFFRLMNGIENNYHIAGNSFVDEFWWIYKNKNKATEFGEELLMFMDFVGSVTNNNIMSGHSNAYYKRGLTLLKGLRVRHLTEAMANYTSLLGGSNSKFWRELLEKYSPDLVRKFDDIIDVVNTTP